MSIWKGQQPVQSGTGGVLPRVVELDGGNPHEQNMEPICVKEMREVRAEGMPVEGGSSDPERDRAWQILEVTGAFSHLVLIGIGLK